ncbi:MAG: HRDC domain-containing protein [Pseudomonadota bacterium]
MEYVNTQAALDAIAERVRTATVVGFDTEFLREKTYHPKLCLAQLNLDGDIVIVDPLAALDYESAWTALCSAEWTLHAGRQDLEVMRGTTAQLPRRIYDTQIAAGLAGLPPQAGYATLVDELCQIRLAKAHTRTDWSRRPLAAAVLDYAADDVEYLPRVRHSLHETLDRHGRTAWLEEDCAALLNPDLYTLDMASAWQRVKGLGRLPTEVQQRAAALAGWRERTADQRDLPRQWVLKDDALIALAFANPGSAGDMANLQGVGRKFADRHSGQVLKVLGGELPPPPEFRPRPDDEEKALTKALGKVVREAALSLNVEPEIIAAQKELRRLAAGARDVRVLSGWRDGLVGDALRALL